MEFEHTPVMPGEVIQALDIKAGGTYIDATAGGGGHSLAIAERLSDSGKLIAVDRDREALEAAEKRLKDAKCQKFFIHANYSDVDVIASVAGGLADGILMDLGVSSYQLDNPQRGFSYMQDAPLDMRMDEGDSLTAHDVINGYDKAELARIIRDYGEENWAVRIAEFITEKRKDKPVETTGELVEIIKAAIPANARRAGPHPAKRTFQAIRIEVNDELSHLKKAVERMPDLLGSGGRLAIITFHSLEDRIVKTEFERRLNPCTCPKEFPVCVCGKVADVKRVTKKPIQPKKDETDINPRARSAKLRVIEKI